MAGVQIWGFNGQHNQIRILWAHTSGNLQVKWRKDICRIGAQWNEMYPYYQMALNILLRWHHDNCPV